MLIDDVRKVLEGFDRGVFSKPRRLERQFSYLAALARLEAAVNGGSQDPYIQERREDWDL